jgi:hypothetical protein
LGKLDAYVELNELAIRAFEKSAYNAPDIKKFIMGLSEEHNIKVQFESFPNLSAWATQHYIVAVHEATHFFLFEYKREFVGVLKLSFEKDWPNVDGNKLTDTLAQVEKLTKRGGVCSAVGKVQIAIFNYYHFLRNRLAHLHTKNYQGLNEEYQLIRTHKDEISRLYNVDNAPNHLDNINFQDFFIFTRAVKEIASKLCDLGMPTPQQIVNYIGNDKFKGLKKFANNVKRQQQYASSVIEPFFGEIEIDHVNAIISIINAH